MVLTRSASRAAAGQPVKRQKLSNTNEDDLNSQNGALNTEDPNQTAALNTAAQNINTALNTAAETQGFQVAPETVGSDESSSEYEDEQMALETDDYAQGQSEDGSSEVALETDDAVEPESDDDEEEEEEEEEETSPALATVSNKKAKAKQGTAKVPVKKEAEDEYDFLDRLNFIQQDIDVKVENGELDEDEEEEDEEEPKSSKDSSSQQTEDKYLSEDEILELMELRYGAFRGHPGCLRPPSPEEQLKAANEVDGSNVSIFRQIYRKFCDRYLTEYDEAKENGHKKTIFNLPQFEAIKDCRKRLSRSQMVQTGLDGIFYEVQNHFGGDSWWDGTAIAAKFSPPDRALYKGGYLCQAQWTENQEDRMTIYHGQTNHSVSGRIFLHEESLHSSNKKKRQFIHDLCRKAEETGGSYSFHVTYLYPDEVPAAVITMTEQFFACTYGKVEISPKRGGMLPWYIEFIDTSAEGIEFPDNWTASNKSLPSKEPAHHKVRRTVLSDKMGKAKEIQLPRGECWICGDSVAKAEIANEPPERFWFKNSMTWCRMCYKAYKSNKRIRVAEAWRKYLWPSEPICCNCGSQNGPDLRTDHSDPDVTWRWRCQRCAEYFQHTKRDVPKQAWPKHLREVMRCQNCGVHETDAEIHFIAKRFYTRERDQGIFCRVCCRLDEVIPARENNASRRSLQQNYPVFVAGTRAAPQQAPIPRPPFRQM